MNSPHPFVLPSFLPCLFHTLPSFCVCPTDYMFVVCAPSPSLFAHELVFRIEKLCVQVHYGTMKVRQPILCQRLLLLNGRASWVTNFEGVIYGFIRLCLTRMLVPSLAPTFELSSSTYVCAWEYICWGEYLHTLNGFWTNNHLPSLYFKARRLVLAKVSRLLN